MARMQHGGKNASAIGQTTTQGHRLNIWGKHGFSASSEYLAVTTLPNSESVRVSLEAAEQVPALLFVVIATHLAAPIPQKSLPEQ